MDNRSHPLRCGSGAANGCSVIAVTGLSWEARIAGDIAIISDGLRTPAEVRAAVGMCEGIISFGVCGGLAPDLLRGQWVIGSSVVFEDECYDTDKGWSERLIAAFSGAKYARIAGVDSPIAEPVERARFRARTGAVASDMESHIVARIASAHKLPFTTCRLVLNPAHRRLPPAALLNLRRGWPDLIAIFQSIMRQPHQVADLFRLMMDASHALLALGQVRLAGEDFAFSQRFERC
jgi:adenosylhomocysteine nucleosidase